MPHERYALFAMVERFRHMLPTAMIPLPEARADISVRSRHAIARHAFAIKPFSPPFFLLFQPFFSAITRWQVFRLSLLADIASASRLQSPCWLRDTAAIALAPLSILKVAIECRCFFHTLMLPAFLLMPVRRRLMPPTTFLALARCHAASPHRLPCLACSRA